MPENNEDKMDFISLMKKKRSEDSKPSVIGEALENADKAVKKAQELEIENDRLKKEDQELNIKNQELEKENKNLKEKIDRTIKLLKKSEEMINNAIEEKKQLEDEKQKEFLKMEFQINDLTNENNSLKKKVNSMENIIKSSTSSAEEV